MTNAPALGHVLGRQCSCQHGHAACMEGRVTELASRYTPTLATSIIVEGLRYQLLEDDPPHISELRRALERQVQCLGLRVEPEKLPMLRRIGRWAGRQRRQFMWWWTNCP